MLLKIISFIIGYFRCTYRGRDRKFLTAMIISVLRSVFVARQINMHAPSQLLKCNQYLVVYSFIWNYDNNVFMTQFMTTIFYFFINMCQYIFSFRVLDNCHVCCLPIMFQRILNSLLKIIMLYHLKMLYRM